MTPWVLVDISFLAHRARYASGDLAYEDFHTGVLFGFWEQLYTICTEPRINSNRVILFFDSRKSYRKQVFSGYKEGRGEGMDEEELKQLRAMRAQLTLLRRKILPAIGFPVYRQGGLESDDLMAQAAIQLRGADEHAIIVTADGDLYQCVNDHVRWYDPSRHLMYDPASFLKAKGIEPERWGMVKAIGGCASDAVPGIPKVGEKTAIKFLTNSLPSHYKTSEAIRSEEGRAIIDYNKPLVVLPHSRTKEVKLREPELSAVAFFDMCERYGFMSYLKEGRRKEWERWFNGDKPKLRRRGE